MEEINEKGEKMYCYCRKPEGDDKMYGCDVCDGWFHEPCIKNDVAIDAYIDNFVCRECTNITKDPKDPARRATTYKRSCGLKTCKNVADLRNNRKFCTEECRAKWAQQMTKTIRKQEKERLTALLEQCPDGMAHFAGSKPGAIPGIDIPLEGQETLETSPYYIRLNQRWDSNTLAERLREELLQTFKENNGGYQHLHDKTVARQHAIIASVKSQYDEAKFRLAFLEAAKEFSAQFVQQHKTEHDLHKLPPIKGKPQMHNPPNDVCGYDYRLHANHQWFNRFIRSAEGTAFVKGEQELGPDNSGEVWRVGGVEDVDPSTVEGTVCVRIKCRAHYDWYAVAASQHRTTIELCDDETKVAGVLIVKVDEVMKFKQATSRLRLNWMKMELMKLGIDQLKFLQTFRGEQRNGDLAAAFKLVLAKVKRTMPADILTVNRPTEPERPSTEQFKKMQEKVKPESENDGEGADADEEGEDERMKDGPEGKPSSEMQSGPEQARREAKNARRRAQRKAEKERKDVVAGIKREASLKLEGSRSSRSMSRTSTPRPGGMHLDGPSSTTYSSDVEMKD